MEKQVKKLCVGRGICFIQSNRGEKYINLFLSDKTFLFLFA